MVITLADWVFSIDKEATNAYTLKCSTDHCMCAYCRNFYETVDKAHPTLRSFLAQLGVTLEGPCEVMPFEPTLVMACYRLTGSIIRIGQAKMHVDGIPLYPEASNDGTFLLWVGEMELPWIQNEPMEDVLSPANEPAFMERMMQKWLNTRDSLNLS